jgi:hypothetical protein
MGTREVNVSPMNTLNKWSARSAASGTYIPCEQHQHHSYWLSSDEAAEACFLLSWHVLAQNLIYNAVQIFASLDSCSDLLRCVCNWPSHLLCKLLCQIILLLAEQLQCLRDNFLSAAERRARLPIGGEGFLGDRGKFCNLLRRSSFASNNWLVRRG